MMQDRTDRPISKKKISGSQNITNHVLKMKLLESTGRKPTVQELQRSMLESKVGWTCQICRKQCALDEIQKLSQCRHMYCNLCADAFIRYKINAKELIFCPNQHCSMPLLKTSDHFRRIEMPIQRKYELIQQFQANQNRNPQQFICKGTGCNEILNVKNARCPRCGQQHCLKCLYPLHNGECQYFQPKFMVSFTDYVENGSRLNSVFKKISNNVIHAFSPLMGARQMPSQIQAPQTPAVLKPQSNNNSLVKYPSHGMDMVPTQGNLIISHAIPIEKAIPPAISEAVIIEHPAITQTVLVTTKGVNPNNSPVDNRASYNDDNPKCTFKNVLLWLLFPITSLMTLVIMALVLLLEIFIAMGTSIVIFIKKNFERSQSKVCTALLAISLPIQVIVGAFGAPLILKDNEEYRFGSDLERAFMFCLKFHPFEVRKCYQKAHGPRPAVP